MDYRDEIYFASETEGEPPFPPHEFAARLTRLRTAMAGAGIDLLFLTAPESMFYLSGYQCEWYQAQSPAQWPASSGIAVHADHDRFILFDSEREAVLGRHFSCSTDTRFFPRASLRDGLSFIVDELVRDGWLRGTVGLELRSYRPNRIISERFQGLLEAAGATVVDGTSILRELRFLKSPAEVACLREAARIADIGLAAARDAIAPGVSELEVYGEIVRAMAAAGGESPAITMPVLSGSKTNASHALSTTRRIRVGEIVTVDVCGVRNRYHVNQARVFSVGEPDADVAAVAALAAGSLEAVRAILRPDLPFRELNETLLAYYRDTGLWERRGWIGGYEMGIAFAPDWVGNVVLDPLSEIDADRVLAAGTCLNCETQVVLPRHVGQFFAIETILCDGATAATTSAVPFDLCVI
jgi:Xaa-Pro aminopeptidase